MAFNVMETAHGAIAPELLMTLVAEQKRKGARFVQMCGTATDDGVNVMYSFLREGTLENWTIEGLREGDSIPSITDHYIAAFVFENELHDLFGVKVAGIAVDFDGKFYAVAEKTPMTAITPELRAAREKAAKAAAAKAAKEAKAGKESGEENADLKAKLAEMDPEKAAKLRAAMEAKAKREAAKTAAGKEGE